MTRKKNMNETTKKPFYKCKPFWLSAVALLLVLALLLTVLLVSMSTAPAVYDFEGATLREDAYHYLFACFKYVYLVRYKALNISDTPAGWAAVGEDGRSYEEAFSEVIREEILLRFVAASLFDANGYRLSDADYDALDALIDEFDAEAYGEVPFEALAEKYGIGENAVKQAALYEKKYQALYRGLFSDPQTVYSAAYREALSEFYKKNYYRYNMIYVADAVGEEHRARLEAALADGVTEEEFTALEASYSTTDDKITSGIYPNGIYLYGGESYTNAFTPALLAAFREADEVGKLVKKRSDDDSGTYYVLRYALDEEPYRSENKLVRDCFARLPAYAGLYLFREELRSSLTRTVSHGIAERYTMAATATCREHNVIYLLGN